MTFPRRLRSLAYLAAFAILGESPAAGVRATEVHHGAWTTAPCCVPNAGGYGYFPTRWRQWPTEGRLDQDFPQAVGRTPVPAPAPLRAAPEGRPGLPLELPAPPMPPTKPAEPTVDRVSEPKPAAAAKGTQAATVPQQAPAVPKPSTEKTTPEMAPAPKPPQAQPAPKPEPKAEAGLPESSPAPSPTPPAAPSAPPPLPKPELKTSSQSTLKAPPLPEFGLDRPAVSNGSRWASPAALLVASHVEEHGVAGLPASLADPAGAPAPQPAGQSIEHLSIEQRGKGPNAPEGSTSQPAGQSVRGAGYLAAGRGRANPALEGFCPVELVRNERWVAGDARYSAEYRGRIYFLSGPAQHQEFLANPERYVPCHSGMDPVSLAEGCPVPGQTDYCAVYDGRLYMFSSPETLARFRQDPRRYTSQLPHGGR